MKSVAPGAAAVAFDAATHARTAAASMPTARMAPSAHASFHVAGVVHAAAKASAYAHQRAPSVDVVFATAKTQIWRRFSSAMSAPEMPASRSPSGSAAQ